MHTFTCVKKHSLSKETRARFSEDNLAVYDGVKAPHKGQLKTLSVLFIHFPLLDSGSAEDAFGPPFASVSSSLIYPFIIIITVF